MSIFNHVLIIGVALFASGANITAAWGLVDYSSSNTSEEGISGDDLSINRAIKASPSKGMTSSADMGGQKGQKGLRGLEKFLELGAFYDSSKLSGPEGGKIDRYQYEALLKIRQDISLEMSYF